MSGHDGVLDCESLSLEGIINTHLDESFNLTQFAMNCSKFCPTAYGRGNPDLTGIGVSISYIIQAFVPLLFSLSPTFVWSKYVRNGKGSSRVLLRFTPFLRLPMKVMESQIAFSLPILVASYVRFRQSPPLYEYQIISTLATAVTASTLAAVPLLVRYHRELELVRPWLLALELSLILGFWIAVMVQQLRVLPLLYPASVACRSYAEGLDMSFKSLLAPYFIFSSSFQVTKSMPYVLLVLILTPAVPLIAWIVYKLFEKEPKPKAKESRCEEGSLPLLEQTRQRGKAEQDSRSEANKNIKKTATQFMLLGLYFWLIQVVYVIHLWRTRNGLSELAKERYSDNEWGFGQVIALLVWSPLLVELSCCIGSAVRPVNKSS